MVDTGLDLQKLSDAKEAAEEAAAVSQYELRIAKEDIKSLQESLERHKEEASSAPQQGALPPGTPQKPQGHRKTLSASLENLSGSEKRDLNAAVQEYLKSRGYKLTAMTFCDEVSVQKIRHFA